MAPKKRGVTHSSSKVDKNDEIMESWSLELGSSDDEAPDEVTFEDSKAQALRSVKQALESARRERNLLKEKRKKRLELFQEQKKRKLLSDNLLEEFESSQKGQQKAEATHEDENEEDEDDEKKEIKKQSLKHSRKLKGNYKVTTAKPQTLASLQQKAAEDFIHSRLYGVGSCRTTSNELLSLQNKTSRTKSAAFCFVKSQWALEKKSKAEKLKRRWIHKQVPSS